MLDPGTATSACCCPALAQLARVRGSGVERAQLAPCPPRPNSHRPRARRARPSARTPAVHRLRRLIGAGFAVTLFTLMPSTTVAWWRVSIGAAVLMAWHRPWRRPWTRRTLATAALFGAASHQPGGGGADAPADAQHLGAARAGTGIGSRGPVPLRLGRLLLRRGTEGQRIPGILSSDSERDTLKVTLPAHPVRWASLIWR